MDQPGGRCHAVTEMIGHRKPIDAMRLGRQQEDIGREGHHDQEHRGQRRQAREKHQPDDDGDP